MANIRRKKTYAQDDSAFVDHQTQRRKSAHQNYVQREEVYNKRRKSFVRSPDIELVGLYGSERDGINNDNLSPHMYPEHDNTSPSREVQYLTDSQRQESLRTLDGGQLNDTTMSTLTRTQSVLGQRAMFARRGSDDPNKLSIMEKNRIDRPEQPSLQSNHSSLYRGKSVSIVGFMEFDKTTGRATGVFSQSGHYLRDAAAKHRNSIRVAEWGDQSGSLDPNTVSIMQRPNRQSPYQQVDVSHARRVSEVNRWAAQHPKPEPEIPIPIKRRNSV